MAVVHVQKDTYMLKRVSVDFREAFGNEAQKTDTMECANTQWKRQNLSTSGYSGDPDQSGKALQLTRGSVTPTWAFSCVVKASVQTSHSARSSRELR